MQDEFCEATQVIFLMYNVIFVGVVVVIVVQVVGLEGYEQSILQAVSMFWGSVISAGAFVIPCLLQARQVRLERKEGHKTNVRISGLDTSYDDTARSHDITRRSRDSNMNSNRGSSLDVIKEEEKREDLLSSEGFEFVQDSNGDYSKDAYDRNATKHHRLCCQG